MDERLRREIEAIAADAESGASELVARAIPILEEARHRAPEVLVAVARAVAHAQPSMAPLWNAAIAALGDAEVPGTWDRFTNRLLRAPAALRRVALDQLAPRVAQPLRIVTYSFSGSVLGVLMELAKLCTLTVACAEGRPRHEGRRLAAALAPSARVEFYTDAALSVALRDAAGFVVGADAVARDWFLNKVGTLALAAAASVYAVPVFVLATRDKFLPSAVFTGLPARDGNATEVWSETPAGVAVRNPYFERIPLDLVTAVVTDSGTLAGDMIAEACRVASTAATPRVLDILGVQM